MKKVLILALLCMISSGHAIVINNWHYFYKNPIDARSAAMGNVTLFNYSPTALFDNPANLALIRKTSVHTTAGCRNSSYKEEEMENIYEREGIKYSSDIETQFPFYQISLARPVGKLSSEAVQFTIAAGYHRAYFDDAETNSTIISQDGISKTTSGCKGGLRTISAGGGINVENKIQLGISYHHLIDCKFEQYSNMISTGGNCYWNEKTQYKGGFWLLGVNYSVLDNLQAGITYQLPFKFKWVDGSTGNQKLPVKHADEKIKFPGVLNAGVTCQPVPQLLLAFEMQYINLSTLNSQDRYYEKLKDGYGYKCGIETKTFHNIPIRFGFSSLPIKYPEKVDYTEKVKNPAAMTGYTVGAGYPIGHFSFDFAFEFSKWSYKNSNNYRINENFYDLYLSVRYDF